jgi:peptidoglycan/LPS O-acetylase OafA/YrhL
MNGVFEQHGGFVWVCPSCDLSEREELELSAKPPANLTLSVQNTGPKTARRALTLDVLRGLFSWIVVAVHVGWMAGIRESMILRHLGNFAVNGFVILSGFVITQLLSTKRQSYRVFITQRFFRLFPAFAVCFLLVLALRPFYTGRIPENAALEASENAHYWWHILAHATLLHGILPDAVLPGSYFAFLVPAWSISLEFQLYLVAPLVVLGYRRYGSTAFAYLVGLSAFCLVPAVIYRIHMIWAGPGAFLPLKFYYFLIGMTLFIRLGAFQDPIRYPKALVWLGEISYSTYLVHWPILAMLEVFMPQGSMIQRALLLTLIGAPIVLGLSYLLHRYVELSGIALGRLVTRKQKVSL